MTATEKLADALRETTQCLAAWSGADPSNLATSAVIYRARIALAEHDANAAEVMYGSMDNADFESDTITLKMEPGYFAQAGRFELRRVGPAHLAEEAQS